MTSALKKLTIVASIFVIALAIYSPGLSGPFIFDDQLNITENSALRFENLDFDNLYSAAFSIRSGPLYRPVSMLSFALNYYAFGENAYSFKFINIIIHALTAGAIFWFSYYLLLGFSYRFKSCGPLTTKKLYLTAFFIALVWVVHPLNLTSVLYVVQRMTSLSALFSMLMLATYTQWRVASLNSESPGYALPIISFAVLFPMAVLSKENALLVPFLIVALELFIFNCQAASMRVERAVKLLTASFIAVGLGVVIFLLFNMDWLVGLYRSRDFTLEQRLATEARVLWHYLYWILAPDISNFSLFHDDIVLSDGLFSDARTVFASLGILLLVVCIVVFRRRFPLFALGICWFLIAHSMESTIFALEITHEHRNYLPMLGVIIPACFLFGVPLFWDKHSLYQKLIMIFMVCSLGFSTYVRAGHWSSYPSLVMTQSTNFPESSRANFATGRLFFALTVDEQNVDLRESYFEQSVYYFQRSYKADPQSVTALLSLVRLSANENKRVEPEWIEEITYRLRTQPISSANYNHLSAFLKCQLNQNCAMQNDHIELIVGAALTNDQLRGFRKAVLLNDMGYFMLSRDRLELASEYFDEAVKASPDIDVFWLSAIHTANLQGDIEKEKKLSADYETRRALRGESK